MLTQGLLYKHYHDPIQINPTDICNIDRKSFHKQSMPHRWYILQLDDWIAAKDITLEWYFVRIYSKIDWPKRDIIGTGQEIRRGIGGTV